MVSNISHAISGGINTISHGTEKTFNSGVEFIGEIVTLGKNVNTVVGSFAKRYVGTEAQTITTENKQLKTQEWQANIETANLFVQANEMLGKITDPELLSQLKVIFGMAQQPAQPQQNETKEEAKTN